MSAIGAMMHATTPPDPWKVPQEWAPDEPCFILCSGESIGPQAPLIKQLKGRFVAVKHGVYVRPNADALLLAVEGHDDKCRVSGALIKAFTGTHVVVRGRWSPEFGPTVKRVTRPKAHETLCELKDHVAGYDCGTSAINLAYHFGARTIVMLGYDMRGGHFCEHPLQFPPQDHFKRHVQPLEALNADAKKKGVRIVNCSPSSAVTAFEKQPLEAFL
jgi:hypothetical protein